MTVFGRPPGRLEVAAGLLGALGSAHASLLASAWKTFKHSVSKVLLKLKLKLNLPDWRAASVLFCFAARRVSSARELPNLPCNDLDLSRRGLRCSASRRSV